MTKAQWRLMVRFMFWTIYMLARLGRGPEGEIGNLEYDLENEMRELNKEVV